MNEKNYTAVRRYIRQYYLKYKQNVWIPPPVLEREFGFVIGPNKVMTRHKGFENDDAVKTFLANEAPLDAYHSAAVYDNPIASMDEKGFRGADLFFDIDADHVDPECGKDRRIWICNTCNEAGLGHVDVCTKCNRNVSYVTFPNKECIEAARLETRKLISILTNEFGFPHDKIKIHYSGNRGFHVYVLSEEVRALSQEARKEIIDYIANPSPEFDLLVIREGDRVGEVLMPKIGLPGRILDELKEILFNQEVLENILGQRIAQRAHKERSTILADLESGRLSVLLRVLGKNNLKNILGLALDRIKVRVDPVVTIDLHRLVRMPGSINSKTGFPKLEVDLQEASADEILTNIEHQEESIKVMVKAAPKIELGGNLYGPYENIIKDLPVEVGVLLILRGVAEVIEY
ncbi:MAG: DNA primase small subunit domain-containing protein [Thermoproteota archaeon]